MCVSVAPVRLARDSSRMRRQRQELEQMLKEKVLVAREHVSLHASMCYVFEDIHFFLSDLM